MEMDTTDLPVVSTTSSIDLLNSSKRAPFYQQSAEGSNGRADSTVQSTDNEEEGKNDNSKNNEDKSDAPSIGGMTKPSFALEKVDFVRDSHNRVKLYVLCDQRAWDDKGTGHVTCLPSPEDDNTWCIVVRLEASERNVLESKINVDTIYQKQQGTLIVWTESDSVDLALSFQEKSGCAELWEKICRIQGKDPETENEEENEADEQDVPSDSRLPEGMSHFPTDPAEFSASGISNANAPTTIPPCNLQNLGEIEQALSNSMYANSQREKIAITILQNNYIPKLCELFAISEDLENKEALHQMASIAKNLFLLNNNAMLNELIDEKHFRSIVGMLEFEASSAEPKRHREFLWERSKFKEVLPISSNELKAKIHQTFRLQYVQDVCLPAPSIFEENLLTVLSSHLFFIRAEIVNSLLNDRELMPQLFEELRNPEITLERQRDLTNFLKEFCASAHTLPANGPQGREQFFKTLMANDVLSTIDPCISSPLASTRTATVELLTVIVDFNPQIFRDFLVRQFRQIPESKNSSLLINKLIYHILSDNDPEFTAAGQMANVLRILLDPESIVAVSKGEKGEFLQMFYKRSMYTLYSPIIENVKDKKLICDSYYMANKFSLIIDLLCFFVEHHGFNMRAYTVQKNLLQSVLLYLKSVHHFLAHCALRLLRRIIGLKDDIYIRHICDKGILDLVVECFVANGSRYNLLNSSLIELFEFIRTEEIRPLMQYTIQKHWETTFSTVDYVRTFSMMRTRCLQFADANGSFGEGDATSKENALGALASMTPPNPQWRKEREHDDEELFFSNEDDDEMPAPQMRKAGMEPMFPSLANRKRKANEDDDNNIGCIFGGNITPPAGAVNVNRISKIMIRMNSKESGRQPQQQLNLSPPDDTEKKPPAFQKSSSAPPEMAATSSSNSGSPTSTLKRPLVDYEDSDEDDDEEMEEEQEGNEAVGSSTRKEKAAENGGKNIGHTLGMEGPKKVPKLAHPDSSTSDSDPASPPPDPEQQQTPGSRRAHDAISSSSS